MELSIIVIVIIVIIIIVIVSSLLHMLLFINYFNYNLSLSILLLAMGSSGVVPNWCAKLNFSSQKCINRFTKFDLKKENR